MEEDKMVIITAKSCGMEDKVISRDEALKRFEVIKRRYSDMYIKMSQTVIDGEVICYDNPFRGFNDLEQFINQPITLDSNVEEAIELISGLQMFELCNIGMGRLKKINQALNTIKSTINKLKGVK